MTLIAGIDPGLEGGLALLDERGGVKALQALPVIRGTHSGLDLPALGVLLKDLGLDLVVLELNQGRTGWGATQTYNMGRTQGQLEGFIQGLRLPLILVRPQKWQRALLGPPTPKVEGRESSRKADTLAYVRRRFPTACLTPGRRSKPHDGLTDALAIAEWGRLHALVGASKS